MVMDDLDYYYDTEDENTDTEFETKPSITAEVNSNNNCCANKCVLRFDDEFKLRLKKELSELQKFEKHIYLFAMISVNENKINATKIVKSSKYFQYTVKEYGISRSVCKVAFVTLHDTTPSLVRTLCNKMTLGHLIPTDNRGKHNNRLAISQETQSLIKKHFYEIMASPNIFKCAKKKLGQPNMSQLWIDFKQKHGHSIARSTYTKYIQTLLTPEVEANFMCANQAQKLLEYFNKKNNITV